jgi:D-alanyl-D-alanine dipeptidase
MEILPVKNNKIEISDSLPAIRPETVDNWKNIPVRECGEKLVPVGAFSSFSDCDTNAAYFGERGEGESMNFLGQPVDRKVSLITHFVRKGILKKLQTAQKSLLEGYYFKFFDNYRPLEVQQKLFDAQKAKLKRENPEWEEKKLDNETQRYVSFPSPSKERGTTHPSPHNTGAVVDLTIIKLDDEGQRLLKELNRKKLAGELEYPIDENEQRQRKVVENWITKEAKKNNWTEEHTKNVLASWLVDYRYAREKAKIFKKNTKELDMGTNYDYFGVEAGTRYYEELAETRKLTPEEKEKQKNRRFFYNVMKNAGFSNYPEEWWHWSFGDNMDAANTGKNVAIYGGVELSPDDRNFNESRQGQYRRHLLRYKKEKKSLFLNSTETEGDPQEL